MNARERRYPTVPWLADTDFRPAGAAEWSVDMVDMIVRGWLVTRPWGHDDALMVIRAVRGTGNDGGEVTVAMTDEVHIDPMTLPVRNVQHSRTFFEEPEDG